MKPTLRNCVAVFIGIALGSIVNMAIIMVSAFIIPPPPGADVTTMDGLKASMHLFSPKHFIIPFLAHALGTLTGAFTASWLAKTHHSKLAMVVGAFFLVGGIMNCFMVPAPYWFMALDIVFAYLPMAYLGGKASARFR